MITLLVLLFLLGFCSFIAARLRSVSYSLAEVVLQVGLLLAAAWAVWSQSNMAFLTGWWALVLCWGGLLWLQQDGGERDSILRQVGLLLVALFGVWWGFSLLAVEVVEGYSLFALELGALLVSALVMMGVWPFDGWRPWRMKMEAETAVLLHLVPTVVGMALLMRLVAGTMLSQPFVFYVTLIGLLGMVLGVRWLWLHQEVGLQMGYALTLIVVSQAALVGAWAGADALLWEGSLLLATLPFWGLGRSLAGRQRLLVYGLALAALAALPLTGGFAGRLALYFSWWHNGLWVLIVPMMLLHVLTLVVLLPCLQQGDDVTADQADGRALLPWVALIGLFAWSGVEIMISAPWLLLFVALPIWGAWAWVRFAGDWEVALRQALILPEQAQLRLPTLWQQGVGRGRQAVTNAVTEAIAILEGEGGLLWLLAVVVLFLLLR